MSEEVDEDIFSGHQKFRTKVIVDLKFDVLYR